ncbi:type II toxin-antitoxin system death-on-curing family toxin [Rhodobacterales bacterium FZCC0188]|nr:type II toxin-antitoxin system death-on-curing family toxin [Rhodobacterales bacterium FZCC0188]
MTAPIWVPHRAVLIIHDRQIARHGGAAGMHNGALIDGALQRPLSKLQSERADIFSCAASYAFAIAKAHAIVDGNKRTAFVTSVTFLRLNGWHFVTDPVDGVAVMEGLASGHVSEDEFRSWLLAGSSPVS